MSYFIKVNSQLPGQISPFYENKSVFFSKWFREFYLPPLLMIRPQKNSSLREAAKKILLLIAGPIRPNPLPPRA